MPDGPKPDPQAPPDPFGPMHAGSLAILESFRAYRAAGASRIEATCLLAAAFIATSVAAGQEDGQQ